MSEAVRGRSFTIHPCWRIMNQQTGQFHFCAAIEQLRRGESPIYEPHLEAMLTPAREKGSLDFTTDLAPAVRMSDVIFIAVGTPPRTSAQVPPIFRVHCVLPTGRW